MQPISRKIACEIRLRLSKKQAFCIRFALILSPFGEMVEWSITVVLKTTVLRGTGGSNPSLSARKSNPQGLLFLCMRSGFSRSFSRFAANISAFRPHCRRGLRFSERITTKKQAAPRLPSKLVVELRYSYQNSPPSS